MRQCTWYAHKFITGTHASRDIELQTKLMRGVATKQLQRHHCSTVQASEGLLLLREITLYTRNLRYTSLSSFLLLLLLLQQVGRGWLAGLVQEGDDGLAAQRGVLLVIGLLVALVLLHRPARHLQESH